jgi:hypothetical protein
MMYDFRLFIARLGDDGAPEAYAIVQGAGVGLDPIEKLFGAAWYLDTDDFDGVFFAGNGAEGIFTVITPIRNIDDDDCWNSGSDYSAHVACDAASAVVVLYSTSTDTPDNDGLNCPTDAADSAIEAFNCTRAGTQPFQLLKATDDDYYSLKKLDDGVYVDIFDLDYTDANDINAAAMYTDADGSFYPYAVFDSQLCRFDKYSLYCYDGTMGVDLANAAAIVGGDRRPTGARRCHFDSSGSRCRSSRGSRVGTRWEMNPCPKTSGNEQKVADI